MLRQGWLIFVVSTAIVVLGALGVGLDIKWVWDVCAIGELILAMARFAWQGYCARFCGQVMAQVKKVST